MVRRSTLACVAAAAAFFAAGAVAHASGSALGLLSLGNVAPVQFDLAMPSDPLASASLNAKISGNVSVNPHLDAPLIANGLMLGGASPETAAVPVTKNLSLHVGGSLLSAQSDAPAMPVISYLSPATQQALAQSGGETASASLDWTFRKLGFGVGVGASVSNANSNLLAGSGFSGAATRAVGVSARFGGGWVTTVSYNEGVSQLNLRPGSLLADGDTVRTQTYGFSVAKHGLFGDNDLLGVAVSRPVQLFGGSFNFGQGSRNSLIGPAPETDISLGYVTTFFNGALALQANAAWQMNLEGQNGTNSLAVLSRAKINF